MPASAGGELRAALPGGKEEIPLPLEHTDVRAAIQGYIASVRVTQSYRNPYASKIEAVYVFPLPENAAVADFVMTIGERHIRGIIREREEAERLYFEARRQGYTATLLTQERPNVFTQRVANIEPGHAIDVEIAYFNTLAYADGEYSFVFPMVVGPRYNPAGSTGGLGAVARGRTGTSGQAAEISVLKPGERSGHDVSLSVYLDAGVSIEEIVSPSHAIDVERRGPAAARVRIQSAAAIPNKDFVLRYRVAGDKVKSAILVERREGAEGYFTLILQPPASLATLPRSPMEMVFVLDTSGSMTGWPIEKAKRALARALEHLDPGDTFQIVRFASGWSSFRERPVPATRENVSEGLRYLEVLEGAGGTEMIQGIRASLDFPHDGSRFRIVSFMTDGFIGNEDEILREVDARLGPSRIFAFGVGSSVNRYLIEGLAKIGRGAVAYLVTRDSETEPVDRFFERVNHPALTDMEIDWGTLRADDTYPRKIPDLFVGRPVIVTGKLEGSGRATIHVRGKCAGEAREIPIEVSTEAEEARADGISKIWARARIASLMERIKVKGASELAAEVKKTALAFNLASAYTAFVAVDTTRRTEGEGGTTVVVPVPVPEGVSTKRRSGNSEKPERRRTMDRREVRRSAGWMVASCVVAGLAAGCAHTAEFVHRPLWRPPEWMASVTDEDIRVALEMEASVTVPVRLAIVPGASRRDWLSWKDEERDAVREDLAKLVEDDLVSHVFFVSPDEEPFDPERARPEGMGSQEAREYLKPFRLAAARQQAEVMVLVRELTDRDEWTNPLGFLYMTVVGLWLVPATHVACADRLDATVVDVRNGAILATATAEGEGSTVRPWAVMDKSAAGREARAAALKGLLPGLDDGLRRALEAARGRQAAAAAFGQIPSGSGAGRAEERGPAAPAPPGRHYDSSGAD